MVHVLGAMTSATAVHLLLWDNHRHDWLLPTADTAGGTRHEPPVPTSVLRYVQRTCEPLVVDDTTRDERFARAPYFTDVERYGPAAARLRWRTSPAAGFWSWHDGRGHRAQAKSTGWPDETVDVYGGRGGLRAAGVVAERAWAVDAAHVVTMLGLAGVSRRWWAAALAKRGDRGRVGGCHPVREPT